MRIILTIISLFVFTVSFAQEQMPNTMYWNNYSLFNPAATALNFKHKGVVVGTIGSEMDFYYKRPINFYSLYNFRWDKINSGIGISYESSYFGITSENLFRFNYAYHFQLKKDRHISLGTSFNYKRKTIGYTKLAIAPYPTSDVHEDYYNLDLGALYQSPRMLIGISVNSVASIMRTDRKLYPDIYTPTRNFAMNFSYDFPIGNNFEITPGFYTAYYNDISTFELNVRATYKKRYLLGMSVLDEFDAVSLFAGIDLFEKYTIAYAIREDISLLGAHTYISELVLGFKLN